MQLQASDVIGIMAHITGVLPWMGIGLFGK